MKAHQQTECRLSAWLCEALTDSIARADHIIKEFPDEKDWVQQCVADKVELAKLLAQAETLSIGLHNHWVRRLEGKP